MTKKHFFLFLCIFFSVLSVSAKQFTVVIDPGHGGKDPGALGSYGQEKTINLKVALKLGELINKNFPDVKVVFTRKTDIYVKLQERPNIANRVDGDLFISIHTNASESSKAYGSETYTLGLSKSQANFNVAKRENSVLLLEEDKEVYQGFDPTSPDSYIMFEFMQSKYIDQSVEIAYYIQKEFAKVHRLDRGVRQAIFWVLHQVKMPSILIELGFVTNPSEERFLTSDDGQQKMAKCIFNAFEKYKHEYDKRTITSPQIEKKKDSSDKPVKSKNSKDAGKVSKSNNKAKEKQSEVTSDKKSVINTDIVYKIQIFSTRTIVADNSYELKKVAKFNPTSYIHENGWYKYMCGECHTFEQAKANLKEIEKIYKDALIIVFNKGKKITIPEAKKLEFVKPENDIVFKVQVFSSRNIVPKDHYDIVRLKKYSPVTYYSENGWYKYVCAETESYEKAKIKLNEIQKIFKDAVIVAFKNGNKISVNEALKK